MQYSNFAKSLSVSVALSGLVCISFFVMRLSDRQLSPTPADLWASAILYSFEPEEDASRKTLHRFAEAISVADNPSDVYISLGDYLRGPIPVAGAFKKAFGDREKLAVAAARQDVLYNSIDQIFSVMNGGEESVAAYVAAVKASPGSRLAHFRVGVYGDSDASLASSQWLTRHDSTNALGLYLEAAHAVRRDTDSTLELLGTAVSRPAIFIPPDVVPDPVATCFPPVFGRYSGRRANKSSLEFIVHRQNTWFDFNDPFRHGVELMLDQVIQIADDCGDPRSTAAIVTHHQACHQLVFNTSANLSLSFIGVFRHQHSYQLLLDRFRPSDPVFKNCEAKQEQILRFRQLLKSHWKQRHQKILEYSPEMIFSGEVNRVAAEAALTAEVQSMALQPREH
ncbi:MAG: hypothetical protein U0996_05250 [Planctomycetaceae bacterium]